MRFEEIPLMDLQIIQRRESQNNSKSRNAKNFQQFSKRNSRILEIKEYRIKFEILRKFLQKQNNLVLSSLI